MRLPKYLKNCQCKTVLKLSKDVPLILGKLLGSNQLAQHNDRYDDGYGWRVDF